MFPSGPPPELSRSPSWRPEAPFPDSALGLMEASSYQCTNEGNDGPATIISARADWTLRSMAEVELRHSGGWGPILAAGAGHADTFFLRVSGVNTRRLRGELMEQLMVGS